MASRINFLGCCLALLISAIGISSQAATNDATDFTGWEGIRVIEQEGRSNHLQAVDLDGDGRDEIITVNRRQARLEIYEWLPKADRETEARSDLPNELPMAREFRRVEIAVDSLPHDVVAEDVNGDKKVDLVILTAPPNRIQLFERDDEGEWKPTQKWDLLAGDYTTTNPLLIRDAGKKTARALISTSKGVQSLELKKGSRASWMQPVETVARMHWWNGDVDGDGDDDLIEWTRTPNQTVRWYEAVGERLLPAKVMFDGQAGSVGVLLNPEKQAEILVLGGLQEGLTRRYRLGEAEQSPIGKLNMLPVVGGEKAIWTGIRLGKEEAVVVVDPQQPKLAAYTLDANGWLAKSTFPIVSKVAKIAAPPASPGALLLWAKDSETLHISKWQDGRMSFPKPFEVEVASEGEPAKTRAIIALQTDGDTTWWAQQSDSNVDLFVWSKGKDKPAHTHFDLGKGKTVAEVVWLGGKRILYKEKFAQQPKVATVDGDGKTTVSEPGHLKQAKLTEFRLLKRDGKAHLARVTDGVLQWMGDDLHPVDQIMLPEGQRLSEYLPIGDGRQAWAMQQGGEFLHKLVASESGLPKVAESHRIHFGNNAVIDPVIGLVLIDSDRIIAAVPGKRRELQLVESIDERISRGAATRDARVHRLGVVDATGDGREEVILMDDGRHHVTLMSYGEEKLQPLIDWQVFEDTKYPYGGMTRSDAIPEPRDIIGADLDNDKHRDLVMISQDRIVIYLGKEEKE